MQQCKYIFRDSFQLIDDPSGNSFIENLLAPKADPDREVTYYTRTKEQDKAVGIFEQDDLVKINGIQISLKTNFVDLRYFRSEGVPCVPPEFRAGNQRPSSRE